LAEIRQGIAEFDFLSDLAELQVGMPGAERRKAEIKAQVTVLDDNFLVDLTVRNEGDFVCDRCGEPHSKTVQGRVRTLFIDSGGDEEREGNEEVRILPPEARAIDILQDAVDALLLAVPVKILCREDCMGLCPNCGRNLNDGPCSCRPESEETRWDALKNIQFDS